jgi:hypothetical protein
MNLLKMWQNSNTVTNQNDIHDEIKSRLNSGNACCHSVQNLFSSCLISTKLKIKVYKTFCQLCCMGAKLGLSLWGRNIDWEFLRTVLRRIFGPKGRKTDHGQNYIMMNFITCILQLIFLWWLNQGGWGGLDMWHAWGGKRCLQGFGWEARS